MECGDHVILPCVSGLCGKIVPGLLANRTRQAKLACARQLLAIVAATPLLSPVSGTRHGHRLPHPPTCRSLPPRAGPTGGSSPGSCHNEGIPHDPSPERFSRVDTDHLHCS